MVARTRQPVKRARFPGACHRTPNLETTMHISRRNKSSRYKAKLKAKKRKERARKHGLLVKRKAGGRLNKRLKREPHAW